MHTLPSRPASFLQCILAAAPLVTACTGADVGEDAGDETAATGIFIEPGSSSESGEGSDEVPMVPAQCDLQGFGCPHVLHRPVMLVLDNSYSMRSERVGMWDHDRDDVDDDGRVDGNPKWSATPRVTHWSSLHWQVKMVGDAFLHVLDLGVTLFPAFDPLQDAESAACSVGATPEIPFGADWETMFLERKIPFRDDNVPGGAAPAAAAIDTALVALTDRDAQLPGAIVLVTDGAANCGSEADAHDERLPEVVAAARARGIPTFVIGIDIPTGVVTPLIDWFPDAVGGVDVRAALSALAEAGGTARRGEAKFFDATDEAALADALFTIARQTIACTLEFQDPVDADKYAITHVEVWAGDLRTETYGSQPVDNCAAESGWRFVEGDRTQVELCGEACTLFQAEGAVWFGISCIGA